MHESDSVESIQTENYNFMIRKLKFIHFSGDLMMKKNYCKSQNSVLKHIQSYNLIWNFNKINFHCNVN